MSVFGASIVLEKMDIVEARLAAGGGTSKGLSALGCGAHIEYR